MQSCCSRFGKEDFYFKNFIIIVFFFLFYGILLQFPSDEGYFIAQYNGKGTRLLCAERNENLQVERVLFHLPPTMDGQSKEEGKVRLTNRNVGQFYIRNGKKSYCFAGGDNELVVAQLRTVKGVVTDTTLAPCVIGT